MAEPGLPYISYSAPDRSSLIISSLGGPRNHIHNPLQTRLSDDVTRSGMTQSMFPLNFEEVNRPPLMEQIPWYHYNISRHIAESLLISTGEDGSYLLRDSTTKVGEFSLSVRSKDAVKHFPVRWDGQHFIFGFGKFANVHELISHFQSKPVIGGDSGILTLLKHPYPRDVDEPDVYDSIRVHTEGGSKDDNEKPTFAIASKDGYLTKLGQHRKTWKTRWFVLYKNELSYFKTREDRNPIRTINLKEVSAITADNSQSRENCFRLVTSTRTFFLIACSGQEAEDWIKILRWKLEHPFGTESIQE